MAQSPNVKKIFAAPGNAGIDGIAQCVPIKAEDIEGLLALSIKEEIDITVVGPDDPLAMGIVDRFQESGQRIFGPTKAASQIEWSKAFAKDFMARHGIPTAQYRIFTDYDEASGYLKDVGAPIVVKASGLAKGKGVIVAMSEDEAEKALYSIMKERVFGGAGDSVVIEEYLEGEETSIFAITDGSDMALLVSSQDHKRAFDNDEGPNTGGMGAYAPAALVTDEIIIQIVDTIMRPTIEGLREEGREYKGVLYGGLIVTDDGPKVIEFNSRFGDPEAQVTLPLIENDLVEVIEAVIDDDLKDAAFKNSDKAAVCVVAASEGYPGDYEVGVPISGLDLAERLEDVLVFHAGTTLKDGKVVTSGGRVLGVTALGYDLNDTISVAYEAMEKIHFDGMHYRKDIGQKGVDSIQ